jgi:hypothetical protein
MDRRWLLVAGLTVAATVGCGGTDGPKQVSLDEVRKTELTELGEVLKMQAAEGKKPPAKLTDMAEIEPLLPSAGPALRNGEVVYFWGSPYAAGSTTVIAHEKKAPTDGGYVLLQDGTVKSMTAAEFGAAPKAKK